MSKNVNVTIEVSLESLAFSLMQLEPEETIEVFRLVDLQVAEVDFTEKLLLVLINSLKDDLSNDEKIELIGKLSSEIM